MNFISKTIYYLCSISVIFYASCNRYEAEPITNRNEDLIFDKMDKNAFFAEQVLNNIYTYLPNGFGRIGSSFLDVSTDDAVHSQNGHNLEIISQARQSPVQLFDDIWSISYEGIRKSNIFLSKIDNVPLESDIIVRWKAEIRFIRAMIYFELSKRYGGIPLLGDRILKLEDDLRIPRNTYEECVQYIIDECNDIAANLPNDPIAANQLGRITKGAALSLSARTLLYAASPLHNPTNNLSKWQKAFDAHQSIIDLGQYALLSTRINAFINRQNTEVILAFQRAQSADVERNHAPVGFTSPNASSGLTSPTQNLVDAFGMANGLPITDPQSGYNSSNPYQNRDARLGQTVFFNNSRWLSRNVELFDGGRDRPGGVITQTRTGYYLKKFMGTFAENTDYSNQHHNFPIFRYAETLLSYAEAANEIGRTDIAYTQLIAVRQRAGISAGTNNLRGLKENMNKDEMREAIRLERRLELAFEEHRFWDVRRWKIAETEFNKPLYGIRIIRANDGSFTYQREEIGNIKFTAPAMYLYPISNHEILTNEAMAQNPGWQ